MAERGYVAEDIGFSKPFIDQQEWRDSPVRHYYVHGGFAGTQTRFSYYFPPEDGFENRFFQHATPIPLSENLAQQVAPGPYNKIGFSLSSGAYFVETNGGGKIDLGQGPRGMQNPEITAFRANAAAAQFSRFVAQQFYQTSDRPFGYLYGGSGGAFRTIGSLERTEGVWDGGVPYVNGSTLAIPNMFSVRMQALRVLRGKFPQIVDAVEPGGNGNPYAGLTEHEASVLREVEKMGFPMESWTGWQDMGLHGFAALYGGVAQADPTYFADFWEKPGYLGHDRPELFVKDRVQHASKITHLLSASDAARLGIGVDRFAEANRGGVDNAFREGAGQHVVGIKLSVPPAPDYFLGGELIIKSGALAGNRLMVDKIVDGVVVFGVADPRSIRQLKVGDEVVVDNSNFLAMESYHRHQVPPEGFPVWDQFRDKEGNPVYPQRPMLIGPLFVRNTAGSLLTGNVGSEKVILAASLWDREAMPWQADWYRRRVEAQSGADAVRLYYTDHAVHGDGPVVEDPSRIVSYEGTLQQSLRLLAAWVEEDVLPPESTQYRVADGQVIVPTAVEDRKGLQPVVALTVGGNKSVTIAAGQQVRLHGAFGIPPASGKVSSVEFDFDGDGIFDPIDLAAQAQEISVTHLYDTPGTYFAGLRVTAQPEAALGTPYAQLSNIDRVRIVVKQAE
ncbi:hypothetical protein GRI41_03640 [Altererythrobacter aquaemixtae]|uniref:PKD domain-containing protein n=1 Tax=Pontixanthobacter aquaemixtae TaxID=1958940 RepID=A0A844ZQ57_9SPHN|nr:hypothetical protein [Pontixanthobacter aquaemixtae]